MIYYIMAEKEVLRMNSYVVILIRRWSDHQAHNKKENLIVIIKKLIINYYN